MREHDPIVEALSDSLSAARLIQGPQDLRPAAVMVPLWWGRGECRLILTKRAKSLRTQPGDIAFPGGRVDPEDTGPLGTALRESHEEIQLAPNQVRILGHLPQRKTVTGFWLTPFVAEVVASPRLEPNEEVEEILEVPIHALTEEVLRIERRQLGGGKEREIYHYQFGEHDIWGITGRLVHETLELLRHASSSP